MSSYGIAHIVHLFCAVIFVGGVFFEALILSVLHTKQVSREARQAVEQAISRRATRVMPFVVVGTFASGLFLGHHHAQAFLNPFASSFNTQLCIKVLITLSVLVHFVIAVRKMKRGTLTKNWSKYIHTAVLIQMIGIVFLAKSMFYWYW